MLYWLLCWPYRSSRPLNKGLGLKARPSARRVAASTRWGFSCLAWLEKKWPSDLWPGLMRREVVRRCPNRDGCPLADGGAPRARLLRGARGGDSIPVPTRVPLRGESGRRGPVPTKLRRWLLRGRPENHQTGRCGMRAGKSLVDRGYTHGDWLQLRRDLSSSTHVRQRGGRVADSLCARSSQDTC